MRPPMAWFTELPLLSLDAWELLGPVPVPSWGEGPPIFWRV